MIPISDDNPVRLTPVVTWAIILLCVAVFIWELSLGNGADAAIDALGFKPVTLLKGEATLAAITILASMFLHGGFLHIGGNMLYLWIFGNNVEDAMGHVRYLLFYLICGVGGGARDGVRWTRRPPFRWWARRARSPACWPLTCSFIPARASP